jgi:methionyl-tRNA formyltransferase
MRILFAGTPALAVPSLEALVQRQEIRGVLTNPDRPSGRHGAPEPSPIKRRAVELGLPVLQPERFEAEALESVRALGAELLAVVAFGRILKKEFLELFPMGGVNLHASLLPRYRGPSPISAVILAGERETGVTVQRLALRMDSGEILAVRKVPLSGRETTGSLSAALAPLGATLLVQTLERLERGTLRPVPQREEEASYCRLVRKEDGEVGWSAPAVQIERMIRAYDPWPRAYTTFRGRQLSLLSGQVYPEHIDTADRPQGLVLAADNRYGILVTTGQGILCLTRLQMQSRRALDWRAFLNGQQDFIGARLGETE